MYQESSELKELTKEIRSLSSYHRRDAESFEAVDFYIKTGGLTVNTDTNGAQHNLEPLIKTLLVTWQNARNP